MTQQIECFTPAVCRALGQELVSALKDVAARHDIDIEYAGGTYSPGEATLKVRCKAKGAVENDTAAMEALFNSVATVYGLQPGDMGKVFIFRHEQYRIVSINPNRPKYPIVGVRVRDNKRFKFRAEDVSRTIKR